MGFIIVVTCLLTRARYAPIVLGLLFAIELKDLFMPPPVILLILQFVARTIVLPKFRHSS